MTRNQSLELSDITTQPLDRILVCSQLVFSLKPTNTMFIQEGIMISVIIQLIFVVVEDPHFMNKVPEAKRVEHCFLPKVGI